MIRVMFPLAWQTAGGCPSVSHEEKYFPDRQLNSKLNYLQGFSVQVRRYKNLKVL